MLIPSTASPRDGRTAISCSCPPIPDPHAQAVDGTADAAWVAIAFLQGSPDPAHPLRGRVIPIALAVLEAQVRAANAFEARLLSPFPELAPLYEARGYQRVADRPDLDYLRKQRTAP